MKRTLSIIGATILILGLLYVGGIGFYSNRFTPNTKYLSVNVGSNTLPQAEAKIKHEISQREYTLVEHGQELAKVKIGDLNPQYKIKSDLQALYYPQNPNNWMGHYVMSFVSAEESAAHSTAESVENPMNVSASDTSHENQVQLGTPGESHGNYSTAATRSQAAQDEYSDESNEVHEEMEPVEKPLPIHLDTQALADELNAKGEGREPAKNAKILYEKDKGFYTEPGENGTMIDADRLNKVLVEHAIQGKTGAIDLAEAYQEPPIAENGPVIKDTLKQLDRAIHNPIQVDMGQEKVTVPADKIEEWIGFNADNQMTLNQDAVREYLQGLSDEYGTFNKHRKFKSTMQGTVDVLPGILGWGIDIDEEVPAFTRAVVSGKGGVHKPATKSTGGVAGAADDIGDTYVEIDLSHQMLFYYEKGELILSTDITSGKPGAETVPGAGCVNEMLHKTNLVGYNPFYRVNYSTPVDYWIRFDDKAQGIHDASWQGSYGGDSYVYSGSLGCINTPYGAVSELFNRVQIGTPVIVFQ